MTPKVNYTVKKSDLDTLEKERMGQVKPYKALIFDFGNPVEEETFVVLSLRDFRNIYRMSEEEEEDA